MRKDREYDTITFGDLDIYNKIAIIGGWLSIISFGIGFILGFIGL